MRRFVVIGMLVAATAFAQEPSVLFEDDFQKGTDRWQFTDPAAWKATTQGDTLALHQFQQSKYKTQVRSPFNIALIKDLQVTDFVLEAKVLSTGDPAANHRDMCLFWGYQDPSHFYYVHMAKKGDDRANQIFIVNGKDREKISKTTTPGTPWDEKWHRVKLVRDTAEGTIAVYWDDMKTPIMTAVDKTFTWGQVGVGSFDDTGLWDDVKVTGKRK